MSRIEQSGVNISRSRRRSGVAGAVILATAAFGGTGCGVGESYSGPPVKIIEGTYLYDLRPWEFQLTNHCGDARRTIIITPKEIIKPEFRGDPPVYSFEKTTIPGSEKCNGTVWTSADRVMPK